MAGRLAASARPAIPPRRSESSVEDHLDGRCRLGAGRPAGADVQRPADEERAEPAVVRDPIAAEVSRGLGPPGTRAPCQTRHGSGSRSWWPRPGRQGRSECPSCCGCGPAQFLRPMTANWAATHGPERTRVAARRCIPPRPPACRVTVPPPVVGLAMSPKSRSVTLAIVPCLRNDPARIDDLAIADDLGARLRREDRDASAAGNAQAARWR